MKVRFVVYAAYCDLDPDEIVEYYDFKFLHPVLMSKVESMNIKEEEIVIPTFICKGNVYILDGHHRLAYLIKNNIDFDIEIEVKEISEDEGKEKEKFVRRLSFVYEVSLLKNKDKFYPLIENGRFEKWVYDDIEKPLVIEGIFGVNESVIVADFTLAVIQGMVDQSDGYLYVYKFNIEMKVNIENLKISFNKEFVDGKYYEFSCGTAYDRGAAPKEQLIELGVDDNYILSKLPYASKRLIEDSIKCEADYYIEDAYYGGWFL
jgi:hypothetical protein